MALPYKLLKTITIDGETMGLDPNLGHMVATNTATINLYPEWAEVTGAEITLTEPGTYIIQQHATFESGSNTSTTQTGMNLYMTKNGAAEELLNASVFYTQGNIYTASDLHRVEALISSDVPARIRATQLSGVVRNNCFSLLRVYKLLQV